MYYFSVLYRCHLYRDKVLKHSICFLCTCAERELPDDGKLNDTSEDADSLLDSSGLTGSLQLHVLEAYMCNILAKFINRVL